MARIDVALAWNTTSYNMSQKHGDFHDDHRDSPGGNRGIRRRLQLRRLRTSHVMPQFHYVELQDSATL